MISDNRESRDKKYAVGVATEGQVRWLKNDNGQVVSQRERAYIPFFESDDREHAVRRYQEEKGKIHLEGHEPVLLERKDVYGVIFWKPLDLED